MSKIKSKGLDLFLAEYLRMIFNGWPHREKVVSPCQPLKIIRKYSAKKGPAPWILFLAPAPRPLQVAVSMLVKLNISMYPFFWDKCIFSKTRRQLARERETRPSSSSEYGSRKK